MVVTWGEFDLGNVSKITNVLANSANTYVNGVAEKMAKDIAQSATQMFVQNAIIAPTSAASTPNAKNTGKNPETKI